LVAAITDCGRNSQCQRKRRAPDSRSAVATRNNFKDHRYLAARASIVSVAGTHIALSLWHAVKITAPLCNHQ
jgi:hypothetical protein